MKRGAWDNRNAVWADAVAAEIADAGVRHAVVSPGGRAVALILGLRRAGIEVAHVAVDERAGAFFALGLAMTSGRPVAIVVTSGSAVANVLPALTEAEPRSVPLVLVSGDRPGGRAADVPQTADHLGLSASVVRAGLEIPPAEPDAAGIGRVRAELRALLARLRDPATRGPLHVNVVQRGAVTSVDPEPDWSLPAALLSAATDRPPEPARAPPPVSPVAPLPDIAPGRRGVVVVGQDCPLRPEAVEALATALGYPVLADAAAGLRRPAVRNLVAEADLVLAADPPPPPDFVVRIGLPPVSLPVQRWLAAAPAPTLRIADTRVPEADFIAGTAPLRTVGTAALPPLMAAFPRVGDPAWLADWLGRAAAARARLDAALAELGWGEVSAADLACRASGYDLLMAANSMAIRFANMFVSARASVQRVMANRGANGIDGTVSTFLGALAGGAGRGLLLIGDQAMQHDLGGLEATKLAGLHGTICVVNNSGSSLLSLFGLAGVPEHGRLVRNPPALRLEGAAAAFGLPFRRCDGADALRDALAEGAVRPGVRLVEAVVPPGALAGDLQRLLRAAVPAEAV